MAAVGLELYNYLRPGQNRKPIRFSVLLFYVSVLIWFLPARLAFSALPSGSVKLLSIFSVGFWLFINLPILFRSLGNEPSRKSFETVMKFCHFSSAVFIALQAIAFLNLSTNSPLEKMGIQILLNTLFFYCVFIQYAILELGLYANAILLAIYLSLISLIAYRIPSVSISMFGLVGAITYAHISAFRYFRKYRDLDDRKFTIQSFFRPGWIVALAYGIYWVAFWLAFIPCIWIRNISCNTTLDLADRCFIWTLPLNLLATVALEIFWGHRVISFMDLLSQTSSMNKIKIEEKQIRALFLRTSWVSASFAVLYSFSVGALVGSDLLMPLWAFSSQFLVMLFLTLLLYVSDDFEFATLTGSYLVLRLISAVIIKDSYLAMIVTNLVSFAVLIFLGSKKLKEFTYALFAKY